MTEISSEGTPIDALETGNVPNSADAARMAQIMQDINASGGEIAGAGSPQNELMPQQPQMRQAPPQMLPPHSGIPMAGMTGQMPGMVQQQVQQQHSQFVPYDDEPVHGGHPRKNAWGTFMERLTDPLVVAVLIFVLSLPALQTFGSKYVPWAFAIGGQLSWLGLIAKAVFGGLLFWVFKTASAYL